MVGRCGKRKKYYNVFHVLIAIIDAPEWLVKYRIAIII